MRVVLLYIMVKLFRMVPTRHMHNGQTKHGPVAMMTRYRQVVREEEKVPSLNKAEVDN